HGSAPGHLFAHLAMSEVADNGEGTKWLEAVADADYNKKPG
ncbi:MAG: cupin domain-containing protein, partial [Proteobacteria bacterium]|nr:cupin domain-containing protein [Pseudomonadota bacterium]